MNLNNMFGKIGAGMCRLSMDGAIAVKTSNGYKTYDVTTNRLTNCSDFVFDIGEEFFFVIPTNSVNVGDIILVNGKPKCVVKVEEEQITVINYDDSRVDTILPERYTFMGNTYFYGKIVSMFGDAFGRGNANNILSYMMMSEMMKSKDSNTSGMSSLLPLMLLNNGGNNIFGNLFNNATKDNEKGE